MKLATRSSILEQVERNILSAQENLRADLELMKTFKGLSKQSIAERVEILTEQLPLFDGFLRLVANLKKSTEPLHLVTYQRQFGSAPTSSDAVFIASESKVWEYVPEITFNYDFKNRKPGEIWSSYHSRAEQDEYFRLIARV